MAGISVFQEKLGIRILMQKKKNTKNETKFNLEMLATNFKDTI